MGMQFAFGITHYDSNQEPVDDESYGRVVARYATWGLPGFPSGTTVSDPLPLKRCSEADLGLDGGDDSMFYPTHDSSLGDLKYYKKKLWCFDYEKMAELDDGTPEILEI